MEAFGIKFNNRTKTREGDAEDPSIKDSEFLLFAALCNTYGVAQFVHDVEYTSNTCAHHINADQSIAFSVAEGMIALAADESLSQYVLFDIVQQKHGLEDPQE